MDCKIIATFVKRTDLMEFQRHTKEYPDSQAPMEYYRKERDVRLIINQRITPEGRIFCRINCPINPLPVKGDFEIPNWSVLKRFLEANGWKEHEVINSRFLQEHSFPEGK